MNMMPRERNRKQKTLLLAAVLGVAAAAMVFSFLKNSGSNESVMVSAVAAASNIPANTILTADMLKMSSFPKELVPPGAATNQESLVGKVTRADFRLGQPVLMANVKPADDMSYIVPEGMRAVTIGLDKVIGVGGFLKQGNRVDVMATFDVDGNSYTKTVLQDVELLALGSQISDEKTSSDSGKVEGKVEPTATLAVMPQDAERLMLADSKGKLRLALRRFDDKSVVMTRSLSERAVLGVAAPKTAKTAPPRSPGIVGGPTPDPIVKPWEPPTGQLPISSETTGVEIEIVRGPEKTVTVVSE